MASLTFAILLTFVSALAINWAWIREHDAASALPPLSVRRPRRSLALLLRNRSWITGFAAELEQQKNPAGLAADGVYLCLGSTGHAGCRHESQFRPGAAKKGF